MSRRRPNAAVALVIVLVLVGLSQGALAWMLIERDRAAIEAREQAAAAREASAERAEARTERVLARVGELLDEVRDPEPGTERAELFRRAERIEQLLEEIHDELINQEAHP